MLSHLIDQPLVIIIHPSSHLTTLPSLKLTDRTSRYPFINHAPKFSKKFRWPTGQLPFWGQAPCQSLARVEREVTKPHLIRRGVIQDMFTLGYLLYADKNRSLSPRRSFSPNTKFELPYRARSPFFTSSDEDDKVEVEDRASRSSAPTPSPGIHTNVKWVESNILDMNFVPLSGFPLQLTTRLQTLQWEWE